MTQATVNGKADTQALVKYDTPRGEVVLSRDIVRQYICPKATDTEIYTFLQLCKAQRLNPFLREAYLLKYGDNQPATMVVGKDAFTRRAEEHPQYDGMRAGVIVQRGEEIEYRDGAFVPPKATLIGGWAEVYRKDHKQPTRSEVSLAEYNTNQNNWRGKAATMIRKVALVQALREAFPTSFAGLYDSTEMGQAELPDDYRPTPPPPQHVDTETGEVTDGETREVDEGEPEATPAPFDRDPSTIRNPGDLFQACLDDFGMTRSTVLREIGVKSSQELGPDLGDIYMTIAGNRTRQGQAEA